MIHPIIAINNVEICDTSIEISNKDLGKELQNFASRAAILVAFHFATKSIASKVTFVRKTVHVYCGQEDYYTVKTVDFGSMITENLDELRSELTIWFCEVLACAVVYGPIE